MLRDPKVIEFDMFFELCAGNHLQWRSLRAQSCGPLQFAVNRSHCTVFETNLPGVNPTSLPRSLGSKVRKQCCTIYRIEFGRHALAQTSGTSLPGLSSTQRSGVRKLSWITG